MKKKIVLRCVVGALAGLTISTMIAIMISIVIGDGNFHPVVPEMITDFGTEINAVLIQTVASFVYGAIWAGASLIWENDNWGVLQQTVMHCIICSVATFPIAYFMQWMPHDILGVLLYYGIFFGIYFIVWILQYSMMKKRIKQMNERLNGNNPVG